MQNLLCSFLDLLIYSLKNENNALTDDAEQISYLVEVNSSLLEENNLLKNQITELQKELQSVNNSISSDQINETKSDSEINPEIIINTTGKKVSIFDLETFKGDLYWLDRSDYRLSDDDFIDTYGNEYLTAYICTHWNSYSSDYSMPTYLLDNEYSICEGQIAWPKSYKNNEGKVWIEFYSDEVCIYKTDPITVDNNPLSFSFNVEEIEKLTIVMKGTNYRQDIIYSYFNLVK